jgi:hypothetical protein
MKRLTVGSHSAAAAASGTAADSGYGAGRNTLSSTERLWYSVVRPALADLFDQYDADGNDVRAR